MWKSLFNIQAKSINNKPPKKLGFSYQHRRSKRARNLTVTINNQGKVVATTPWRFSQKKLESFLRQKETWIKKKLTEIKVQRKSLSENHELIIFGKKYQKTISFDAKQNLGIHIMGGKLVLNLIPQNNEEHQASELSKMKIKQLLQKKINQERLQRFLKNTAKKYIIPRTHQLAKKMDVEFKRISLRQQKTRWGSCSSQKNLNFNWRLVHYSPKIIDYVIIHELAHCVHLDHSRNFWQLVAKYDPEYPRHQGYLRRAGMIIE